MLPFQEIPFIFHACIVSGAINNPMPIRRPIGSIDRYSHNVEIAITDGSTIATTTPAMKRANTSLTLHLILPIRTDRSSLEATYPALTPQFSGFRQLNHMYQYDIFDKK